MEHEVLLEERQSPGRLVKNVLEWTEDLMLAACLVAVVFTFIFRVFTVDGRSMVPTYENGDRVLLSGTYLPAEQGDVVVVVNTLEKPIIKRVIATEGQVVDFDGQSAEVTVDGQPLKGEAFGIENGITVLPDSAYGILDFPQTVPEGCVFVLGDNRTNSTDSRFQAVGMVDRRNILGKVLLNIFPFSKFGPVEN